jgi:hypothetical protein
MMAVSRRKFIRDGALLGMLAATPLAALASAQVRCMDQGAGSALTSPESAASALSGPDALAAPSQGTFERQLNSRFMLLDDSGSAPVPLQLAGIRDFKSACGDAATAQATLESFTLSFSCDRPAVLPQGTYTLAHPELGSFALFLVPSAGASGFHASINRLRT